MRTRWLTLAVAAVTFLLAFDGGAFSLADRSIAGIAAWWTIALVALLGVAPVYRASRATLVAVGLLVLYTSFATCSVFWATSAEDAYLEATRDALYLGAFVLIGFLATAGVAELLADGIGLGIVGVATLSVISRCFPNLFADRALTTLVQTAETRLSYPIDYWNGLGALVALAYPLILRWIVTARERRLRAAAVAAIPICSSVLFLTASRGAVIAFCIASAIVVLVLRTWRLAIPLVLGGAGSGACIGIFATRSALSNRPDLPAAVGQGRQAAILVALVVILVGLAAYWLDAFPQPRWLRGRGRAALIAAVVLLLAGIVAANPVARFHDFERVPGGTGPAVVTKNSGTISQHILSGTGTGRWQLWSSAVKEFETRPIGGRGAGSFEAWWAEHGRIAAFVANAHSLYFESLATLGIVGFLFIVGFMVAVLSIGVSRLRTAERPATASAFLGVFAAFAFTAGIDWIWQLPAVSLPGLAAGSVLCAGPAPARADAGFPRVPGRKAVTAVLATLLVVAEALPFLTQLQLDRSAASVRAGNGSAALASARAARSLEPWAASPYEQLALVLEKMGRLSPAERTIEQAKDRSRSDWRLWLIDARIKTELGKIDPARASLIRAIALNPRSPLLAQLEIRLKQGQE